MGLVEVVAGGAGDRYEGVVVVVVVGGAAPGAGVAATATVDVVDVASGAHRQLGTLQLRRPHWHQRAGEHRRDGGGSTDGRRHPGAPVPQGTAANGHFDQVVTDGRDRHRDPDPGQEERIDAPVQALPGHDQEDRPVPEVHAIGDPAPLRQRRQLQEADDDRARRNGTAKDDGTRRQAGQEESTAEREGRRLRRGRPERRRAGDTGKGQQ